MWVNSVLKVVQIFKLDYLPLGEFDGEVLDEGKLILPLLSLPFSATFVNVA